MKKRKKRSSWLEPLTLARDWIIRLLQDRSRRWRDVCGRRCRRQRSQEDYRCDDMEAMYLHIHKWETKERVQKAADRSERMVHGMSGISPDLRFHP